MSENFQKIHSLDRSIEILNRRKEIILQKSLESNDAHDIMKAQLTLSSAKNIMDRGEQSERKSFLIDPYDFQAHMGYKDKPTNLSYSLLFNMSKTPIINAIIRTRVNQVASFAEPQKDKYSMGYTIRKKRIFGRGEVEEKLSKQEEAEIASIYDFLENCGRNESFENEDFDGFIRKIARDSLTYDQYTFEIIRDARGVPFEFVATDASTFRIASSYDDDRYRKSWFEYGDRKKVKGYYPSFVQIYENEPVAEFYPWELSFGVRNPLSLVSSNGYGVSELEEMVSTVTSMIYGDEYNRRFFKQGSSPKGMFRVSGNINESKLQSFKQEWNATMRGVYNSWKTAFLEADKVDWIDMQKSNKDMEFAQWQEYLIKIGCAIYCIDPAEVNFPLSGNSNSSPLFEGNPDARMKHSKDKGLYPILKHIQKRINKFIVQQLNPKYEFVFTGMDTSSPKDEMEADKSAVTNFMTINEIRAKRGLKPVEGGDIILNATYTGNLNMERQSEMEANANSMEGEEEGEINPFEEEEENPFEKAFNSYLEKLTA